MIICDPDPDGLVSIALISSLQAYLARRNPFITLLKLSSVVVLLRSGVDRPSLSVTCMSSNPASKVSKIDNSYSRYESLVRSRGTDSESFLTPNFPLRDS